MKIKMIKILCWIGIIIFVEFPLSSYTDNNERKVEIKGDWFYINGEEFLVKGVAYSPWRPGELPWSVRPNHQKMEEDFKKIEEGGFNTIRTWSPLTEEEVILAKKYNLMIIQGVWIDPVADPLISYRDPNVIDRINRIVSKETKRFKNYDNILMFLVGNEMPVESVMKSGVENTKKMLKEIKKTVKKIDPGRYVSFANWSQLAFIDHSFWDVICFNVYNYFPVTISHSLGFDGYVRWLKETFAKQKPLLITEYGLSISRQGPGKWGYGGNSIEEQANGCVFLWDSLIQAGASGGCIFEWNDEWWKNYESKGDEDSHDDGPEEWFGILGIEGTKDNYTEKLRPAYYAMKEYNQAIIVEPRKYKFYKKSIPIKVYTTEDVYSIKFNIDGSEWVELKHNSTHWWKGEWKNQDKEVQSHILTVEAIDKNGEVICKKQMTFWTGLSSYIKEPRYFVCIDCKEIYYCGGKPELINVLFKVVDEKKKPVKGATIKYSFYETRLWEQVSGEKITDENGIVNIDYYIREPGYIIIAAGVDYKYKDFKKRYGNIRFIEVVSKKNSR